ncbi:hypothetical protein L596_028416 [Steinernema carpocapsae]|uniref:Uncharacterized protein n=1 Tax=Steinernema carpocapsae TaxID=34508 RepID=A0A4U5LYF3_STECR|nr:hypothetical protein L596_028416 [Steinernema carpocapsae]
MMWSSEVHAFSRLKRLQRLGRRANRESTNPDSKWTESGRTRQIGCISYVSELTVYPSRSFSIQGQISVS